MVRTWIFLGIAVISHAWAQSPLEVADRNQHFFSMHQARLTRDIERLKQLTSDGRPDWKQKADLQLLNEKQTALGLLQKAKDSPPEKFLEMEFTDLYDAFRTLGLVEPQPSSLNSWGSSIITKKSMNLEPPMDEQLFDGSGRDRIRGNAEEVDKLIEQFSKLDRGQSCTLARKPKAAPFSNASAKDFLDSKRFPRHAAFLKKIGVTAAGAQKLPPSVDLSSKFKTAPAWQGGTYSCTASAIVNAVEFQTGKRYSVDRAYGQMVAAQDLGTKISKLPADYDQQLSDGLEPKEVAAALAHSPISTETLRDFLSNGTLVEGTDEALGPVFSPHSQAKGKKAKLIGAAELPLTQNKSKNAELLKLIVASGKSPILMVDSDARSQEEDWMEISSQGSVQHVMTLVGYGEEPSPYSLKPSPYFLVRDSLSKSGRHVKVPAENLLTHLTGLIQPNPIRELK